MLEGGRVVRGGGGGGCEAGDSNVKLVIMRAVNRKCHEREIERKWLVVNSNDLHCVREIERRERCIE